MRHTRAEYTPALRYSFGERIAAGALGGLITGVFGLTTRHLRHGCRWHLRGPLDDVLRTRQPVLVACWHQDVLPLFHYLTTFTTFGRGRRRFVMLASRSFDGEVTERIMRPWGFRFVRGSAGKEGGRAALRGLRRALAAGESAVVVADGPLPPPFAMQPGAAYLARATGAPLFVARAWARPQVLVARTWFRLAIPLPHARIALHSAGPVDVAGGLEAARERAERRLNGLCEEADAQLYLDKRTDAGVRLCDRPV